MTVPYVYPAGSITQHSTSVSQTNSRHSEIANEVIEPLQLGDRVVLTREGTSQPAAELKAIWVVEQLSQTHAVVRFDPDIQITPLEDLGRKRYPLHWLALYRRNA
ncbi:MAG: hypothetical protein HC866_21790 [Leptolyngbyaceae cyanobacterium RU_5_1]|nr:hypothetical protein [Leptolyngbyaceae cyanobacterium RU_5_1]